MSGDLTSQIAARLMHWHDIDPSDPTGWEYQLTQRHARKLVTETIQPLLDRLEAAEAQVRLVRNEVAEGIRIARTKPEDDEWWDGYYSACADIHRILDKET